MTLAEKLFRRMLWHGGEQAAAPAPAPAPAAAPAAPAPSSPGPSAPSPQGTGPGPEAAPGSAQSETPDLETMIELMRFDPFDPEAKPPSAPTPAAPASGTPASSPGAAPAAAPGTPAAEPATPPGADDLLLEIARLEGRVEGLTTPQAPPAAQPQDPIPQYVYTVPDALLAMLNSENPEDRRKGLQLTMRAVSRSVHQLVIQEVAQVMPGYVAHMITTAGVRDKVRNGFYDKYPMLNKPALRPMVVEVAKGVLTREQPAEWSMDLGDRIAAAVYAELGLPIPGAAAPAPTVTAPAAPAPPVMMPTTARPNGSIQPDEFRDFIENWR